MKRLSKEQSQQRSALVIEFEEASRDIDEAVMALNEKIDAYNAVISKAGEFRDDIVAAMEEYEGERSEQWQEGDAGQAYAEWRGEWENLELSEMETIESPDTDHGGELEALQDEPNV